jgi:hypothetical protein
VDSVRCDLFWLASLGLIYPDCGGGMLESFYSAMPPD